MKRRPLLKHGTRADLTVDSGDSLATRHPTGSTIDFCLSASCPLRVKLRSLSAQLGSPLYPQEQTSPTEPVRSEKCHKRLSQVGSNRNSEVDRPAIQQYYFAA